jgi:eukaryotic-like serine/threonine-protein kinase
MITQQDRALSRLAVKNNFMDKEAVRKCFREMKKLGSKNDQSVRFEDLAVEHGYLSNDQATAITLAYQRLRKDAERRKWSIKGYEIYNKIGEGGLGVVFKAKQISMNRLVALKILHKRWLNDEEFKQRFLVEARLVGKLSHQNLIKVYDVGREDWKLYFSMEFVEGETLEDLIERDGPLETLHATNITLQILRGVNYISRYEIVHCDIKPSNILLSMDGAAKLGDFGFVKSNIEIEVTEEGSVLGTPDYIAPEQAMGKDIDFRADMYSLGITLYHMVARKPPFDGTASMIMRSHIRDKLPSPKIHNPNVSEDMIKIINRMTEKNPDDRYKSIEELFEAFETLKLKEKSGKDSEFHDLNRKELVKALKLEKDKTSDNGSKVTDLSEQVAKMQQLLWGAIGVAVFAVLVCIVFIIKFLAT